MSGTSDTRRRVLAEMGIKPVWRLRAPAAAAEVAGVPGELPDEPAAAPLPAAASPVQSAVAELGWDALEESMRACRACSLCERRQQAVPGAGDRQADWLFVGEGPGAEEDERGEPFVDPAGKLLDAMLAAISLKRGQGVFLANAVKCRPPGNRTPEASEFEACRPYLDRQIALIQPRLIVALGRPAAQSLLGGEVKISASRGKLFEYQGIPVVVTYHPAYLLRNLGDKARAWEDLCFAQDSMDALQKPEQA